MTATSNRFASGPAIARAIASLLAPAENGTTILIVLGSDGCAPASNVTASTPMKIAMRNISQRIGHLARDETRILSRRDAFVMHRSARCYDAPACNDVH